jgi:hypothetical protein
MHGINGFLFANLPGLDMCLNDKISWHLIGYGNEVDIHGAYFHGQTFLMNKNRKDAVNLIPGERHIREIYCPKLVLLEVIVVS